MTFPIVDYLSKSMEIVVGNFFKGIYRVTLFRKKRFEINFFVQRNASKFAIFIEKGNPLSFFRFSFRATLSFSL